MECGEGVNMQLENQVCSLKLSKRIDELGVKADSLFYWWSGVNIEDTYISKEPLADFDNQICPAYTVDEVGEILPSRISLNEKFDKCKCGNKVRTSFETYLLDIRKSEVSGEWIVRYIRGDNVYKYFRCEDLADAMAKMLIYLLENNLISKDI